MNIASYLKSFKASHPFSAVMASVVIIIFSIKLDIALPLAIPLVVDIVLIQFLTGMINDYLDFDSDNEFQREKPLVRGVISKEILFRTILIILGSIIVLTILYFPMKAILIIFSGMFFAQSYNFWLKDTPFSLVSFDISFGLMAVLPFMLSDRNIFGISPQFLISGAIIASILHVSNSSIDYNSDQNRGSNSFVQWLGRPGLRYLVIALLVLLTMINLKENSIILMIALNFIAATLSFMMLSTTKRDQRELLYYLIVIDYLLFLWLLPYR